MEKPLIPCKPVYISKSIEFSAAHYYSVESWSDAQNLEAFGRCADKASHGHNYVLHVTLKGLPDKRTGMIINLITLKQILEDSIMAEFDHKNLNIDSTYFRKKLPTTENICKTIWEILYPQLNSHLATITLFEDEDLYSYYKGDPSVIYLTRVYRFSASHRLNNPQLSEAENQEIFGKCNNEFCHGHNFKLEVTIKGEIDPITGMIYNLVDLDSLVQKEILDLLDHKNLNQNVPELQGEVVTGENLVIFIWNKLVNKTGAANLHKIKLYETDRNYFEYLGA